MNDEGNVFSMRKVRWITILAILMAAGMIFYAFREEVPLTKPQGVSYEVINRWDLPFDLLEISGIAYLDTDKIAAIQDEDGILYIYNLKTKEIEKKIHFEDAGDYEGVAVVGKNAYVLNSHGTIYEIKDFQTSDQAVATYKTPFTNKNNMESLTADATGEHLLLVPKYLDLNSERYKGIYSFSLASKKMAPDAIFKIDMESDILKKYRSKKSQKTFLPSDMAIHPKSGEMYVLEGTEPKLLILDTKGNPIHLYHLDKRMFPQPEGIAFGPDGRLYISSEGNKNVSGSITELQLQR